MKTRIVFALVMALITTSIVSFTLVAVHYGFSRSFVFVWMKSWMISYVTAVPLLILLAPRVNALVTRMLAGK
jgi:hypothetical protein